MKNFYNVAQLCLLAPVLVGSQSQYTYNYNQYPEVERGYQYGGGRRQDVLQGQFLDVRQQQQQLEDEAELVEDPPVPVVIRGLQILNNDGEDAEFFGSSGSGGSGGGKEKPAFSFDNDTTMNLDGPGYALSLLLIGEIVILAMAFFSGGLGLGGRSLTDHQAFPPELSLSDLGHGLDQSLTWLADLANLHSGRVRRPNTYL